MRRVIEGLSKFQQTVFPEQEQEFQKLASSQSPEVLFITCSDSRIVPTLITQTNPGELFICRNAGNIVPSYTENTGGVSATIEYAVMVLNVSHIVVCGHSDCGAMKGVLYPEKVAALPAVSAWLRQADAARQVVNENYPGLTGPELLSAVIQENVVAQLDNLRTHPSVASRLRKGQLQLHGWVYHIASGEVKALDQRTSRFVPLAELEAEKARSAGG